MRVRTSTVRRCGGALVLLAMLGTAVDCSRKPPDKAATRTPNGGPQRGGRLVLGLQQEPEMLNTVLQVTKATRAVCNALFSRFVTWDDSLNLVPDLITEIPTGQNGGISPDNLTYTYHLRHGVRWHDGQPLTSADVEFTYRVIMDSLCGAESQQGFDQVVRVDTPDSFTVIFHLKQPYASFVSDTFSDEDVLPQHLLQSAFGRDFRTAPYQRAPIGSGPFKLKEWVPGSHITVTRNDAYYGGAPYLDEITFKFVPDANALGVQLQAGDLDGYDEAEESQLAMLKTLPGIVVHLTPSLEYEHLDFNCERPILEDVRVRRALAIATDRAAIASGVYGQLAQPARADVHPLMAWYEPAADTANAYDPERAKALLAAAGWRDSNGDGIRDRGGKPLRLEISTTTGRTARERTEVVLQQQWRAVGVDLVIRNYNASLLFASKKENGRLRTGRFDVALFGWGQPPDPSAMREVYGSKAIEEGQNFGRFSNTELDSLAELGTRIVAQALRVPVYQHIEAILLREMPVIPLVWSIEADPMTDRLHNFRPNPTAAAGDTWNVHSWWLTPRATSS